MRRFAASSGLAPADAAVSFSITGEGGLRSIEAARGINEVKQ